MIDNLSTALLAPILIMQGRYVRRVIPRLPEAKGARSGVYGAGPKIRLLIVGDSAAAGVGVNRQDQALSGALVSSLGSTHEVTWKMLAKSGYASGRVLDRLKSSAEEPFDFVLVSLGVNDVTARTGPDEWANNLLKIIALLKSKFCALRILFSSVPPMHRFVALPQPLRWWLGARAKKLNAIMGSIVKKDDACLFVSVTFPVQQAYLAKDGFHPGEMAYALWGAQVAKMIQAEMNAIEG